MARRAGIEPTTRGLHLTSRFPESVDYIFIRPLGARMQGASTRIGGAYFLAE